MKNVIESIEQFLEMAKERNLKADGSARDLCFTVDGLKLDPCFNVSQTRAMFLIHPRSNDALILIPQDVVVRPDAGVSCEFITSARYPAGWKCIFPNTFLNVNGEIIELVFSVAGALANLSLYNLIKPKATARPTEVITVEVTRIQEDIQVNSSLTPQNRRNENGTDAKSFDHHCPPDPRSGRCDTHDGDSENRA